MKKSKDDATPKAATSSGSARKLYKTPKLRVYGDVAELTRAVGNSGMASDSGHGSMSKTS